MRLVLLPVKISDDLVIAIGGAEQALSPRQGLALAERLARKAFRRVLAEEANRLPRRRAARPANEKARQ
jgi:hypothetical protein